MMVFSLKPALASLTTAALVSDFCCARLFWANDNGTKIKTRETGKRIRAARDFIGHPYFLRKLTIAAELARPHPAAYGRRCRNASRYFSRTRYILGKGERCAHISCPPPHPHYNSPAPGQPGR